MALKDLDAAEMDLVLRCLKCMASGGLIEDWEFETVMGVNREDLAAVAKAWPKVDESAQSVALAINNTFVNILWYPHRQALEDLVSASEEEVQRVFAKWKGGLPDGYFQGMM